MDLFLAGFYFQIDECSQVFNRLAFFFSGDFQTHLYPFRVRKIITNTGCNKRLSFYEKYQAEFWLMSLYTDDVVITCRTH